VVPIASWGRVNVSSSAPQSERLWLKSKSERRLCRERDGVLFRKREGVLFRKREGVLFRKREGERRKREGVLFLINW
jgi:hypothetical protein